MTPIYIEKLTPPPVDRRELLRYAGVRADSPEMTALADSVIAEALPKITCRLAYRELSVSELPTARLLSEALTARLGDSSSVVILAATVGLDLDRLINRASATSQARALLLDALGAERIESLLDLFEKNLAEKYEKTGRVLLPRFSAGYGNIPLELQKHIFKLLDCPRSIGLTLTDSLVITPTKSVTAFIGIKEK